MTRTTEIREASEQIGILQKDKGELCVDKPTDAKSPVSTVKKKDR